MDKGVQTSIIDIALAVRFLIFPYKIVSKPNGVFGVLRLRVS